MGKPPLSQGIHNFSKCPEVHSGPPINDMLILSVHVHHVEEYITTFRDKTEVCTTAVGQSQVSRANSHPRHCPGFIP